LGSKTHFKHLYFFNFFFETPIWWGIPIWWGAILGQGLKM